MAVRRRTIVCPVSVGRERELADAAEILEAVTEHGRVACVGGEAGVGKTRFVAEVVQRAARRDYTVLQGGCTEGGDGTRGPIAQALRRHLSGLGPEAIAAILDSPARLALTLVPELVDSGHDLTATGLGSEHVGIALWHLLEQIGRDRPVLLVIEDIHWANDDTLRLLRDLALEIEGVRGALLLSYRSDELHRRHPLLPVLAELRRLQAYDLILLEPLTREQLRELLSCTFGGDTIGDELLDAVNARTGGNPFFTEELCRALVESGDVFEDGNRWNRKAIDDIAMPESVRETVAARLAKLPDETARILRVAAIAGHDINLAVIAAAAGTDHAAVEHAIGAGLDHQLLAERLDPSGPRYGFRHSLTREALAADVIGPRRQHIHRDIADSLRAQHGDDPEAVAEQIAEHYARAGMPLEAAEFSLIAARDAARQGAQSCAAGEYQKALLTAGDDVRARAELLVEAALATWTQADRRHAVAFATEARELAAELEDPILEARAMEPIWRDLWWSGRSDEAYAMAERALRLVEGRDDWTEATWLQHITRGQVLRDRVGDATHDLIARGIALARRAGHIAAEGEFHNTLGIITTDAERARAEFAEALRLVRRAGQRNLEVTALANAGSTHLWSSSLPLALEYLAEAVAVAERHHPGSAAYARATQAWALSLRGELDAAAEAAAELATSAAMPSRMVALTALAEVDLVRGDLDAARARTQENLDLAARNGEPQRAQPALALMGRIHLAEGSADAIPIMERVLELSRAVESATGGAHWLISPDLARALADRGDGDRLQRLLADPAGWGDTIANRAAAALVDARVARHRGDVEAARRHAGDALTLYREVGYAAREVEALLLRASLGLETLDATAQGRADADTARQIAVRLDSPPLIAEADSLLRRAGVVVPLRRRRSGSLPGGLSERELEVARLVARGLSNAEIARRLFLSERTAGNHVSNILAKLDLARRSQVAAWVVAEGVASRSR